MSRGPHGAVVDDAQQFVIAQGLTHLLDEAPGDVDETDDAADAVTNKGVGIRCRYERTG
ncbi:hypothetical protein [Streptomyces sp. NRRL S-813]|uniref:hypothetical protein n=1 Tax=Streptomyces sp. NRRL S-813 TaxID=1463919 RepID=UPI0018FF16AE|nr:hypothetical protein [Streptomyces sp. NRRL S-813]